MDRPLPPWRRPSLCFLRPPESPWSLPRAQRSLCSANTPPHCGMSFGEPGPALSLHMLSGPRLALSNPWSSPDRGWLWAAPQAPHCWAECRPMLGGFISTPTWQQSVLTWLQMRALPALGSPGPPAVLISLLSPHTSRWAPHPSVAAFT